MGALQKAELVEITNDANARPVGEPVPVQFNPTTLALKIANRTEGGEAQGRPARQYIATTTTLTVDLVFDTADEGETDRPRSVRERTAIVERFVLPRNNGEEVPPKLRFRWGDGLSFDGVVGEVNIDFDHFAHDGTPLRAKVGLSLTEQDAKYKVVPSSAKGNAPAAGLALGGSVGLSAGFSAGFSASASLSAGIGVSASAGVALGGETAADFAARVGLDPAAWRGLDVDLSGGLTLEAGVEVGFDASLTASAGLGASVGFSAGAAAPVEASFGLAASPGIGAGVAAVVSGTLEDRLGAGFALAAAGGVEAAVEAVQVVRTAEAAQSARQAFAASAPALPEFPKPGLPEQPRPPLARSGARTGSRTEAAPAPRPPQADPRAATWGFGVPLRPRITFEPVARARATEKEKKHGNGCRCGCDPGGWR